MKFSKIAKWSAAALVASTAFVGSASANDASRPISGTAHGGFTGEVTQDGALVFAYTGISSHLGAYTRREEVFVEYPAIHGTITFVAANGSELVASFTGQFLNGGLEDASGTYTFAGGTGRFADATGTAAFTAHAPNFGDVSVSFAGTIGY